MGYALLFSGQGMQHAAMLPWLTQDALVAQTCTELGVTDWRAELQDARWSFRNVNAQVLLTGINLAAWGQLSAALPAPAAVAGYSVGELASFAAAGVFGATTALSLAGARARAMDHCAVTAPGGLMAVSGLAPAQVEDVCAAFGIALAIDNDSHAVVLGGPVAALDAAVTEIGTHGAHCTRLHVGLASHTHWMDRAVPEFAQALAAYSVRAPRVALFSNALDRVMHAAQVEPALSQQIASTVRWSRCMENIHARRVSCVLEVGPGAALARMWNQRFPHVPARSADEFSSAAAVTDWVLRQCRD